MAEPEEEADGRTVDAGRPTRCCSATWTGRAARGRRARPARRAAAPLPRARPFAASARPRASAGGTPWPRRSGEGEGEVVRHGDFAPFSTVWRGNRVGGGHRTGTSSPSRARAISDLAYLTWPGTRGAPVRRPPGARVRVRGTPPTAATPPPRQPGGGRLAPPPAFGLLPREGGRGRGR